MQFIKNFFNHDKTVVGLCGIKRTTLDVKINKKEHFKKTYMPDFSNNYLLF